MATTRLSAAAQPVTVDWVVDEHRLDTRISQRGRRTRLPAFQLRYRHPPILAIRPLDDTDVPLHAFPRELVNLRHSPVQSLLTSSATRCSAMSQYS